MNLGNLTAENLAELTAQQINNLVPDGNVIAPSQIMRHMTETLRRLEICINSIRTWTPNHFNYLHSSQYCTYLYYLSNTIWRNDPSQVDLCTKIFLLNKSLNAIDLFYEVPMPDMFFIGHSVGIVLTKTNYGNYFAVYQNCTVGKNHGISPNLSDGLLLYPGSAIIGRCKVGENTVIAAGVTVLNTDVPSSSLVFQKDNSICFKLKRRNILEDIFRL